MIIIASSVNLVQSYQNPGSHIGYWLKHVFGLSFLDLNDVELAYQTTLEPAVNAFPELMPFSEYLTTTYVYPPKLWARFPTSYGYDMPCTTNGCESYHSHLKDHIGNAHPNVYKFAKVMIERQELVYVKLQSLLATRNSTLTAKQREMQETCEAFLRKNLTSYEFIHKLSFKFLPTVL